MIVRMATARRRTTANRTALSATTAERRSAEAWSVHFGQEPVVWGSKYMTNMKAFDLQYGKRVQGNWVQYTNCYTCAVMYSNSYCINTSPHITAQHCHANSFVWLHHISQLPMFWLRTNSLQSVSQAF